jgi:hypothetical protein
VALATADAGAQESAQVLASRALFEEGRRLMAEGRYAEACVKLEESQNLRPGIGTQFNLAECHEKTGRTASAWSLYLRVASETKALGQTEREEVARARATVLEAQLSRLTIEISERVPGLEIELDGAGMTPATWGIATPVDPGDHELAARAPGHQSWKGSVHVEPADADAKILIPALTPAASAPAAAAQVASSRAPDSSAMREDAGASSNDNTVPYIVGGAGVAGVVLGGLFGLRVLDKNGEAEKVCVDRPTACPRTEIERHEELKKAARGARGAGYALFGLGLVGVGVSAVWLLSTDDDAASADSEGALHVQPAFGASGAGVWLDGRF